MSPVQGAIYEALLGRYRGEFELSKESGREFARLGRVVMYLLEAATNPSLILAGSDRADEEGFTHPPLEVTGNEPLSKLLREYTQHELPWKYEYLKTAIRESAARGEKVLVWS